jgi:hypothetical protein
VIDHRLRDVPGAEPIYRLITTILDPTQAPAKELAALYHERWEIETALDELKTHLRCAQIVLRSKTPELVEQEFWGLLMAHYAIRGLMHEAALRADEDPDRFSFLHSVRVVQRRMARYSTAGPIDPPNELFRALGNHLRWEFDDRPGKGGFHNAIEYGKATVAGEVSGWLQKFAVSMKMEWEPRWQLEMYYQGRMLGAVALQLALAVANAESLFTCNGCGRPYIRPKQRKPNAGQANFCFECAGRRKPQREAEKRYRENRTRIWRRSSPGCSNSTPPASTR